MYSLEPSFLGLFTKSSHNTEVTAVIARAGAVAGISILQAILGFPFFFFVLIAEFTKFTPFFSSAVIISSVREIAELVSSDSPKLSAQSKYD